MGWADRSYYHEEHSRSFGGLLMPGGRTFTTWLIIANITVFFADAFLGRIEHGAGTTTSVLREWGHFSFYEALQHGQVWRFITYQFLHMDGWHLFFNMLTLFFFGPMVEQYLGSKRFLVYYLACGIAGAAVYLLLLGVGQMVPPDRVPFLLVGDTTTPMIGASAAVFGVLMGAYRVAPDMQVLLFFIIPATMRTLIVLILLMEVYTLMAGRFNSGGSAAHLGGVILGALLIRRAHWLDWVDGIKVRRLSPARFRQKARKNSIDRRLKREQAFEQEVDRILDKVNAHGLHSLTWKEKRTLQKATEKQRQ